MKIVEFCPSCGSGRWADAQFCGSCGLDIAAWERGLAADTSTGDVPSPADDTGGTEATSTTQEGAEAAASVPDDQAADPAPLTPLTPLAPLAWSTAPLATEVPEVTEATPPWLGEMQDVGSVGSAGGSEAAPWVFQELAPAQPSAAPAAVDSARRGPAVPVVGLSILAGGLLVAAALGVGASALLGGSASSPSPSPSLAAVAPSPSVGAEASTRTPAPTIPTEMQAPAATSAANTVTPVTPAPATPPPAELGWTPAGQLIQPRWGAATAALANGDVLVAGGTAGRSSTSAVAVAEVYHVISGAWEVVDPMRVRRSLAAAATLLDGRVLVFGGSRDGVPLASAELFDPTTGTWTSVESMAFARTDFAAVRLDDGRVMALGGGTTKNARSVTASAEIYDPETRSWRRTGSMLSPRAYATAVKLPDGAVLVAGGRTSYFGTGGAVEASAERWSPDTGGWTITGSMSAPRYFHGAATLPGGDVLVAGGWPDLGTAAALRGAEIYDWRSGGWRSTSSMSAGRAEPGMVALDGGQVLLVGGEEVYRAPTLRSTELFDPTTETWTSAGDLANRVWYPAAAALPGNRALVAGGATRPGGTLPTGETEVFNAGP